ncbi:hypothetical protein DVB69_16070 [Sporosarcina sp. BI001-red]|uniref:TolB family protein n=1 Tax=Sporosarcina sp. BI001-red TaxID=2282866 RepID=UPI000E22FC6F|nr:hypothetical protein [Sporosarcina sp. BI001-red]REB05267.1 hypothetical protein DVB69_16070 [Sporosarcina sp. BI001-red]
MRKTILFSCLIVLVTGICLLLGFTYNIPDEEKQQGLSGQFDVSSNGNIAYVTYEKGKPTLHVKSNQVKQIVQLPSNQSILDLAIMPDGKSVLYVNSDKELDEESSSTLHQVDIKSGVDKIIFTKDAIVTELAIDPKDENRLFYIQANKFSNYSPGATLYPYDCDVYSYQMENDKHQQHTELNKYSMSSLQVSSEDDSIYIQMDDDADVETEENGFETKGRVFKIPLANPDYKMVISIPEDTQDLYDFVLIPDRSELVYQAVANTNSAGIYEYELFSYNWETQSITQLTHLHAYAKYPIYGADGKVYFMVDDDFGGRDPENSLYRMNPDGSSVEEVSLEE